MFLAYQPHLHEQQKRREREAAAKGSPGFNSPSTASISSTLRQGVRPSAASSSSASSTRRSSSDGNTTYSKDDASILTSTTPSSGISVFNRKRFHRPRTSGGGNSKPASPAQFGQSSPSTARPHHQIDATQGDIEAMSLRGRSASHDLLGNGSDSFATDERVWEAKYKDHASVPLHISIPPVATYPEVSPFSEGTFASSGYQDSAYMGRASGLDGLGISSDLNDSQQLDEDKGTELGSMDLSHYPLPIRLGLIHPAQLGRSARKRLYRTDLSLPSFPDIEVVKRGQPTQYSHGYYLYTPPPCKAETKLKSPTFSINEHGKADGQIQSPHRMDMSRRLGSGRGRSSSDISRSELIRRPSTKSYSSEHSQRWKLEQYFTIHKRKSSLQTREYKYHAYPSNEACYWWGYNVKTLVSESLVHDIITSTAGLSVLDWSAGAPSRVLDLGTGTGKWVVEMARQWKETEFIGLDLVPVQTPLTHMPDEDLQGRVSWVVANALQGLPFPDHSFDYIHIRLINSGIPEDKWEYFLSEVVRVLTPTGQLEILESDWSFFGSPREMMTRDLQDLLAGSNRLSQDKLKVWKRRNGKRYDVLGAAVEAMMSRRLVKKDPASMIPFHLMNLEVSRIGQGKPRHLPVLARSSTYRSKKSKEDEISASPAVPTKSWTPEVNDQSFTMRPQIGQPLPPHQFHVSDLDTLRMAILVGDVTRISEARTMIWQETVTDPTNSCPWEHFGDFDRHMDEWFKDMNDRADLENLLKSTFDWNEAAARMDSRYHLDRENRKRRHKEVPEDVDVLASLSQMNLAGLTSLSSPSPSGNTRNCSPYSDNGSDYEDQDTVREGTPTPNSFQQTTAILAFRTTTVFTAQKKT